jgi:hypothetical protein
MEDENRFAIRDRVVNGICDGSILKSLRRYEDIRGHLNTRELEHLDRFKGYNLKNVLPALDQIVSEYDVSPESTRYNLNKLEEDDFIVRTTVPHLNACLAKNKLLKDNDRVNKLQLPDSLSIACRYVIKDGRYDRISSGMLRNPWSPSIERLAIVTLSLEDVPIFYRSFRGLPAYEGFARVK